MNSTINWKKYFIFTSFLLIHTLTASAVTKVSAGLEHTCSLEKNSLTQKNELFCWGSNQFGQLGINRPQGFDTYIGFGNLPISYPKTKVIFADAINPTPTDVSAGKKHTCAVVSGNAYCWGSNQYGQLAQINSSHVPVKVNIPGLSTGETVLNVFASLGDVSCALTTSRNLYCWGDTFLGGTGNGDSPPSPIHATQTVPKKVHDGVNQVSLGAYHGCLITISNEVKCWGDNDNGELGIGNNENKSLPTEITSFPPKKRIKFISIASGADHTCLTSFGEQNEDTALYCWGQNSYKQLGIESDSLNTPTKIMVLSPISTPKVFAGGHHTCLLNGDLKCWGRAEFGELGINFPTSLPLSSLAQSVYGAQSGVTQVSTGGAHTCFIKDSKIYCAGLNKQFQIKSNCIGKPCASLASPTSASNDLALSSSAYHTCSIKPDNKLYCWGDKQYFSDTFMGTTNIPQEMNLTNVRAVAVGEKFTSAIVGSGDSSKVLVWGYKNVDNFYDNYPIPPAPNLYNPVQTGASQISAGKDFLCTLKQGEVYCWGWSNYAGQLGRGSNSTIATKIPTKIQGPGGVSFNSISTGGNHACAITGSGNNSSVYCWGDNSFTQLGLNNGNEVYAPTLVPGFSGAQKISAGQGHTCAMMNDQRVKCVGAVFNGMIQTSPTYISNVTNTLSISSGSHHTCAVVSTGTTNVNQVKCWGRKGNNIDFFQYGLGPFGYTSANSAMTILGLSAVTRIFSGPNSKSTFSVSNAGILKSWGRDDVEQLAIEKKNFVLPIELNQIPVSDY